MVRRVIACCVLGVCVLAGQTRAEPEVFSKAGYKADQTAAADDGKLHVLYFTASWCPPCQQMKKTTWVDESVVSWLEENAVVTPIDVDTEVGLSQQYGIQAMPTIVVLDEGEETARTVGYQGPVELRDWLVRAEAGEIENTYAADMEAEREQTKKLEDLYDRMEDASGLVENEQDGLALKSYMSIWEIILADGTIAEICDIEYENETARLLISRHEPARGAFLALRDGEQEKLKSGDVTWDRLTCWAVLNDILSDYDATVAWMKRRLDRGESIPDLYVLRDMCNTAIRETRDFNLLAQFSDPLQESMVTIQSYKMISEMNDPEMEEFFTDEVRQTLLVNLRQEVSEQYAIAIGIEEPDKARQIAEYLLMVDNTPEAREALRAAAKEFGFEPTELPE